MLDFHCCVYYSTEILLVVLKRVFTSLGSHPEFCDITVLQRYTQYSPFLSCQFSCLVPQPDPNTPKPEGRQIIPVKGEPLGVVSNWPPALQAALARWGATQAKSPALTALDITGKPLYTLTYGERHVAS